MGSLQVVSTMEEKSRYPFWLMAAAGMSSGLVPRGSPACSMYLVISHVLLTGKGLFLGYWDLGEASLFRGMLVKIARLCTDNNQPPSISGLTTEVCHLYVMVFRTKINAYSIQDTFSHNSQSRKKGKIVTYIMSPRLPPLKSSNLTKVSHMIMSDV